MQHKLHVTGEQTARCGLSSGLESCKYRWAEVMGGTEEKFMVVNNTLYRDGVIWSVGSPRFAASLYRRVPVPTHFDVHSVVLPTCNKFHFYRSVHKKYVCSPVICFRPVLYKCDLLSNSSSLLVSQVSIYLLLRHVRTKFHLS